MLPFTNPSLVEKDGEVLLRDDHAIGVRNTQIGELQIVLDECVAFLHDGDFPASVDDVLEVLEHGRDGLLAVVWNRADREAKRLKCRPYVAKTWRENEREAVTQDQWLRADMLQRRFDRIRDGLAINTKTDIHVTEDGQPIVEAVVMAKRIEDGFTIRVTDQMKADVAHLLDIAAQVKALELQGVNAIELVEKYVRADEQPADVDLYRDITFRRHPAGTLHHKDLDFVMNHVALNNPNNNPLNR